MYAAGGSILLTSGTVFTNNTASVGATIFVEVAVVVYILPVPMGHYISASKCQVTWAPCPEDCYGGCGATNISLKPATSPERCGQLPPYNYQSCPWSRDVNPNALGQSILHQTLQTLLTGSLDFPVWPIPCSRGSVAAEGSTTCNTCEPGKYEQGGTACSICPVGEWCSGGLAFLCGVNTYANMSESVRATQDDCIPCGPNAETGPNQSATYGASSIAECGCTANFFRNSSDDAECIPCPIGADCTPWNTLTATLRLKPGYWRVSASSADVRQCPDAKSCLGNLDTAPKTDVCGAGIDPNVPYCSHCLATETYLHADSEKCKPCSGPRLVLLGYAGTLSLLLLVAVLLPYFGMWQRVGAIRKSVLRVALHASFEAKGKQLLGFYQIVSHLHQVYGIVLPPHFQALQRRLDVFNLNPFALPGLELQCFGLPLFASRLLARAAVPLVLVVISIGYHWWCRKLAQALPFTLWLTFLVFSLVSSPAFQAFNCEAFDNHRSYLRADYSVICSDGGSEPTAYTQLKVLATLVILLYPIGIPAAYTALLFALRQTSLSSSVRFLTASYCGQYYW